jgi:hypothetical protein
MLVQRGRCGVRVFALGASLCAALVAAPVALSAPAGAATGIQFRNACVDYDGGIAVRLADQTAGDSAAMFQIGFGDQNSYPSGGGPTQLAMNTGQTYTVHLAGKASSAQDYISVLDGKGNQVATSNIAPACPPTIHSVDLEQTIFGATAQSSCSSTPPPAGQSVILAGMQSLTPVSEAYQSATGLKSIPYTLSLVSGTGKVSQTHMFDFQFATDTDSWCFTAPSDVTATYQVRAVGVDGSVVAQNVTVKKSSSQPTPSPTPSKPHPSSPPPSSPPSHTTQPSHTPGSGSHPATQPSATQSSAAVIPGSQSNGSSSNGAASAVPAAPSNSASTAAASPGHPKTTKSAGRPTAPTLR